MKKINAILNRQLGIRIQAKHLAMLALLLLTSLLQGCISRKQVMAEVWLMSQIPADICAAEPRLSKVGTYRRLNDDVCREHNKKIPCYEVISYCKTEITNSVRFNGTKFKELLDANLPEQK